MTYEETTVGQTIDRLRSEPPDLDNSADGALDNLDQFHTGGAGAVDLLIGGLALAEGDPVLVALMCRECCPGAPCDDHACDVDLITIYQVAHSQLAQQTD